MKYSTKLTLVFLLALYMAPLIFAPSYGHSAIPTEPNPIKDFTVSADWYNASWPYRQIVSINGSTGAGTDYQVILNVTYDSDMQSDFDDLIFTDNDDYTELDFWVESYVASSYALVWVAVADDLGSDVNISMYYGNPSASSASDGAATFPNLYDDWTVESMQAAIWDQIDSDGSVSWDSTDATHGTVLKLEGGAADTRETYESDNDGQGPIALMFRAKIEDTTNLGANTLRIGMTGTTIDAWAFIDSTNGVDLFKVRDSDGNDDNNALSSSYLGSYITYQITRNDTYAKLFADGVLVMTSSCAPDADNGPLGYLQARDEEYDLYVDWIAARTYITDEPVVDSFGSELENPYGWREKGEARVFVINPFHMWGLNSFLIFGGLIMIPLSTLYLAVGLKEDRSSTRLYYGLIMFMIGCALFVGGIMP